MVPDVFPLTKKLPELSTYSPEFVVAVVVASVTLPKRKYELVVFPDKYKLPDFSSKSCEATSTFVLVLRI